MLRKTFSIAVILLLCSSCCLAADPDGAGADRPVKKVVFIAGPKDHGGPGAHEYEKDLRLLKACLEASPNVDDVVTELYVGNILANVDKLDGADVIVIHSSGDRLTNETHSLFPIHDAANPGATYSPAEKRAIERIDGMMKRGTGLVVLHYSLIVVNPKSRDYMLDWIDGYHGDGSRVKIDRSEARPAAPEHPILRGVKPWTTDHEYYFNQVFRKDDSRRTPLLTSMLPSDDPKRHVIAWATQRDNGRGFVFTGGHYHNNVQIESYRRMLLNAILWTANVDVPDGGVVSGIPKKRGR